MQFYTYGVKNEFDSRFENTFEKPFAAPEFQAPFTFHVLSGLVSLRLHGGWNSITSSKIYGLWPT